MEFHLVLSNIAKQQLLGLKSNNTLKKRYKAVIKSLRLLQADPRHPGLNTHEYPPLSRKYGVKIYEAYAENNTPGAYRIFWRYGKNKGTIEIMVITPHP